jgi:hypothetical protein
VYLSASAPPNNIHCLGDAQEAMRWTIVDEVLAKGEVEPEPDACLGQHFAELGEAVLLG